MNTTIICSFIGPDKTGLVKLLAKSISECGGNWLESSMAQLAGHFAGIVRIAIATENVETLRTQLAGLEESGLSTQLSVANAEHSAANAISTKASGKQLQLNIVGNDRPGIIHEVAHALTEAHINVVNMQTHLSSAPMSGDSLFHSSMLLDNNQHSDHDMDIETLERELDAIAERLSVEIDLDEVE